MADSGFVLAGDEKKVMEIEGEYRYRKVSSILGFVADAFDRLLVATKYKTMLGHIVITDKRVTVSVKNITCCCITTGQDYKNLIPSAVKQVGFEREPLIPFCPMCCHMYYLYFDYVKGADVERSYVRLPAANEASAAKMADTFYRSILELSK